MTDFQITSKTFGGRQILGPISLKLIGGEITALLGASGVGKSTLLRIIAGLANDDAGTVQPKRRLGMVFQEPRLLPWKTALQNVELAGEERGLLAALGVAHAKHLYPRQLSLGMARRVSIARALASNPQLLILDEPFASLDEESAAISRHVIMNTAQNTDITTLFVTHDKAEAKTLATRIFTLLGQPAQLLEA